ncbi:putative holin-like toxin [Vulcanibacillus modesticaldus]
MVRYNRTAYIYQTLTLMIMFGTLIVLIIKLK